MWISRLKGKARLFTRLSIFVTVYVPRDLTFKDVSFIICSLKLVDDKISNVILPL